MQPRYIIDTRFHITRLLTGNNAKMFHLRSNHASANLVRIMQRTVISAKETLVDATSFKDAR